MDKEKALNILGLDADASLEAAKKAYRSMAKKFHPDLTQGSPVKEEERESRMKEINLAFRFLAPVLKPAVKYQENGAEESKTKHESQTLKKSVSEKEQQKEDRSDQEQPNKNESHFSASRIFRTFFTSFKKKPEPSSSICRQSDPSAKKKTKPDGRCRQQDFTSCLAKAGGSTFKSSRPGAGKPRAENRFRRNQTGLFQSYHKYMKLKKMTAAIRSKRNRPDGLSRIEKISPAPPVNPVGR